MDTILDVVKLLVIAQIIIIFFILLAIFGLKIFFRYKLRRDNALNARIKTIMNFNFYHKKTFSREEISFLQQYPLLVLQHLKDLAKIKKKSDYLSFYITQLSDNILKLIARKYSTSSTWFKRYIAAWCYTYGFDAADNSKILTLIKDDILLVSINAAFAVSYFPNHSLINAVLTHFSNARRLRQAIIADIIGDTQPDIADIIQKRIHNEPDIGVKIFCYRLLSHLPSQEEIFTIAKQDLKSPFMDLKIAVIRYLASSDNEKANQLLFDLSHNQHWQIRAVIANILGSIHTEKSIAILKERMQDRALRVRLNAAYSLAKKGNDGIKILKEQSRSKDKFAYETAQDVLRQMGLDSNQ